MNRFRWKKYQEQVRWNVRESLGKGYTKYRRCRIHYCRGYYNRAGDLDGVAASIKPILDALVYWKVLPDDDPQHLVELTVSQEKMGKDELRSTITLDGEPLENG